MRNLEYEILSKANARNSNLFYNKTNGFPVYKEPDLEKCEALVLRILAGEFNVGKEPIDIHKNMTYIQPRFEHSTMLQKIIKEKINDANGNTDKCSPVLVYDGRGENGEDKRGDGNHTVFGASESKHAVKLPVARVPYEVHSEFTDEELKAIGNLLNRKADIVKGEVNESDGIKHLLDNFAKGVPHDSNSNIKWLKAYGFTGSLSTGVVKKIITATKIIIDKEELAANNRLFINYKANPHKRTLEDATEGFRDSKTCSMFVSSGQFAVDRVLQALYAAKESGKKEMVINIHHPSPAAARQWKLNVQPLWITIFDYVLSDKFTIIFHEMATTMSDGTK